jgi:hypothetical protein
MDEGKTALTRALNDRLRVCLSGGRILVTQGVAAQGSGFVTRTFRALIEYDAFTADNDPHGEHDFGSMEIEGHRLFWKIDYYDLTMTGGAEDPSDPAKCHRVLTVMLVNEY